MTQRALRSGACGITLALLAACATTPPPATVVLLPGQDGETGAVVVSDGHTKTVLDTPYASVRAGGGQPIEQRTTSEPEVRKQFGATLASLPPRPTKYTLYFLSGTDQFTSETRKEVQQVLAEVAQRPAAEVVVIGHTDRVGADLENDKLSLQRARRVKTLLIPLGIPEDRIVTAGRGEREPIVPTADNVDEPKNRRVEINVR
jgi:outer membrane protein OmpA-like peptidoglycan-associated protein